MMMMNPKKLSEYIRQKKMKMAEGMPDVVETDPMPRNANDVDTLKQQARMDATIGNGEEPSESNETDGMSEHDAMTVGLTSDEMTRMGRLRKYIDTLSMW